MNIWKNTFSAMKNPKATTSDIVKYLTDELGLYEEYKNRNKAMA